MSAINLSELFVLLQARFASDHNIRGYKLLLQVHVLFAVADLVRDIGVWQVRIF